MASLLPVDAAGRRSRRACLRNAWLKSRHRMRKRAAAAADAARRVMRSFIFAHEFQVRAARGDRNMSQESACRACARFIRVRDCSARRWRPFRTDAAPPPRYARCCRLRASALVCSLIDCGKMSPRHRCRLYSGLPRRSAARQNKTQMSSRHTRGVKPTRARHERERHRASSVAAAVAT